jgi:hypothetical protein
VSRQRSRSTAGPRAASTSRLCCAAGTSVTRTPSSRPSHRGSRRNEPRSAPSRSRNAAAPGTRASPRTRAVTTSTNQPGFPSPASISWPSSGPSSGSSARSSAADAARSHRVSATRVAGSPRSTARSAGVSARSVSSALPTTSTGPTTSPRSRSSWAASSEAWASSTVITTGRSDDAAITRPAATSRSRGPSAGPGVHTARATSASSGGSASASASGSASSGTPAVRVHRRRSAAASSPGCTTSARAAPSSVARSTSHARRWERPAPVGPVTRAAARDPVRWTRPSSAHRASRSASRATGGGAPQPEQAPGRRDVDEVAQGRRQRARPAGAPGGRRGRATGAGRGWAGVDPGRITVSSSPSAGPAVSAAPASPARPVDAGSARSAAAASAAHRYRSPGWRRSSRRSTSSAPGGASQGGRGGSEPRRCRCRTVATGPRPYGGCPVNSTHATHPSAYRSVHGPSPRSSPSSCSGAMYAGVPLPPLDDGRTGPDSSACAMPKSARTGCGGRSGRSRVRSTFPGLRSRCSTPRAWACASASRRARSAPRATDHATGPRPSAPSVARGIAYHDVPAGTSALRATVSSPWSRIRTMWG